MKKGIGLMSIVFWFAGCGDSLADNSYFGDPVATIQGSLNIEPGDRPNDTLQLGLIWNVESAVDFKVNQDIEVGVENIGNFFIDLLTPPPDSALNADPETGGKLGSANIFAYDDPKGEGPIDLSKMEPKDYPNLFYRWRGGAEDTFLFYAKDPFPLGSRIAGHFGRPIDKGFFLVRAEGDCWCYLGTPEGRCVNSSGESCGKDTLTILSLDSEVELHIVNEILGSSFKIKHSPDWLFFE